MDTSPEGTSEIGSVAVVGAGTMGWQIAALTAASGRAVALHDALPGAAERAIERMRVELPALASGPDNLPLPPPTDVEAVVRRVRVTPSLADAVAGADLVVEAVREELATKRAVFA